DQPFAAHRGGRARGRATGAGGGADAVAVGADRDGAKQPRDDRALRRGARPRAAANEPGPPCRRGRVAARFRLAVALASAAMDLAALDHKHIWHPFTQQQGWVEEPPLIVERAEGATIFDTEGRAYIDGVSSLWCNVHGHRHPAIDLAVQQQLQKVAHSTMLGLTHGPAIELARRLVEIAPPG